MPQISPGQSNVSVNPSTGKSFGSLPDMTINEDTSLQQIQDNYKQIGSDYNQMATAAANDVGARQRSLIGNDFGATNAYMYNTYYQPAATNMASRMRMEGTQQALETGMERGQKAAEQAVEDAKKNYNNSVDAYNNAVNSYKQQVENTYKNPVIAEFDGSQISDTQMQELMNYANLQGKTLEEVIGDAVSSSKINELVKDWGEVGKSADRTRATNATLEHFGYTRDEYDKWSKEEQDALWARADVGNYWTQVYANNYVKEHYPQETYNKYQEQYDQVVRNITKVYNYANKLIEEFPLIAEMELLMPVVKEADTADVNFIEKMWKDDLWTDDGEHIPRDEIFKKYITDPEEQKIVQEVYKEFTQKGSHALVGGTSEPRNDENTQKAVDIIAMRVFGRTIEREGDAKMDAQPYKINFDKFITNTLGVDMSSIRTLTELQKNDPDKYDVLLHQAASVIAGAQAIDIADGNKWYKTANGYEQLPAGTAVMFTLPGTTDADGNIIDQDLKEYLSIVKDLATSTIPEDERDAMLEEAEKAYEAYQKNMMRALELENVTEMSTTADTYGAVLYLSDPYKYKDLSVYGTPISEVIAKWNEFAKSNPDKAYKKFIQVVKDTYQNVGGYYAATPTFMGQTEVEFKEFETDDGRERLGKEGESLTDPMQGTDASVLFTILTASMNQWNQGNKDGNVDPTLFMNKDNSGALEDFAMKTLKGVETTLDLISASFMAAGKAASNFITGEWDQTFTTKSISVQQLVDACTGNWDRIEEDGVSLSSMFTETPKEGDWNYTYDMRNWQQENLADVFNPLLIDGVTEPMGAGRQVTARGVGFWENPTAAMNLVTGIGDMVVNNLITGGLEAAVGGAVKSAVTSAAGYVSQGIINKVGISLLNNLDDAGRATMLNRFFDNLDETVDIAESFSSKANSWQTNLSNLNDSLLTARRVGGKLSIDYSDDFIRGVSILANGTDEAFEGVNKTFKEALKESLEKAEKISQGKAIDIPLEYELTGASKYADEAADWLGATAKKASYDDMAAGLDKIADALSSRFAKNVYQDVQLSTFLGVPTNVLNDIPENVRTFASKAVAANVSRGTSEAVVITTADALSSLVVGQGAEEAIQYVAGMSREGLKDTINKLFDAASGAARAGVKWTSDDTLRFLARNGWGEMRTAILRKEWVGNLVENYTEDIIRGYTEPRMTDNGYERETIGEYMSNPMNHIMALGSGAIVYGGKKIYNRIQLARTSKALDKAFDAYTAAGGIDAENGQALLRKVQKLEDKAMRYANKALDAGASYDTIQEMTKKSNDIIQQAQNELESSVWWNYVKNNGDGAWKTQEEFFKAVHDGKVRSADVLYAGSRLSSTKAIVNYFGNATALGYYNQGLASITDRATLAEMYSIMHDAKIANAAEIQGMNIGFWDKQKLMYDRMRDAVLDKYGKTAIGMRAGLDEFFSRVMNIGKDLVDSGELSKSNMRLGYLPIESLFNVSENTNAALHGLQKGTMNILDGSTANATLSRGIDEDDLVRAFREGNYTDVELRDMDGKVIMDGDSPKKFQLNPDGLQFLDRLTCYQNGVAAHRYLDPVFGKSDADLGAALLQNKSVIANAPEAAKKAAAADAAKIDKNINKLRDKINKGFQGEAADANFMAEIEKEFKKSQKAIADNLAADANRATQLTELTRQRRALEKRLTEPMDSVDKISDESLTRVIGEPNIETARQMYLDGEADFKKLVDAYRNGEYKTRADRIASSKGKDSATPIWKTTTLDGAKVEVPVTDALEYHMMQFAANGGEVPRDAAVYMTLAKKYGVPQTVAEVPRKYKKAESLEWEKDIVPGFNKSGNKAYTRGELNRIKISGDDGSFSQSGMKKASSIISQQIRSKMPAGANGDRIAQAIDAYASVIVRDRVASGLATDFSDIIEIYDEIAPDVDLINQTIQSGLLKKLNSMDNADITIDDLISHFDVLEAKARVSGAPDLADIESANDLLHMIADSQNRAKSSSGFQVVTEVDIDEDASGALPYSGPIADITGRTVEDVDIATSGPIDAIIDKPVHDMGVIPRGDIEWVDTSLLEKGHVSDGIESLNNILSIMDDPRAKGHSNYRSEALELRKKGSIAQRKEAGSILADINEMASNIYHSGKSTEFNQLVDNEVRKRAARQATAGVKKINQQPEGYDFLEALGVTRPEDAYSPVSRSSEFAAAQMAKAGEGDVQFEAGFDQSYSGRRLEASVLGGHMAQAQAGLQQLKKFANIDTTELDARINTLVAALPQSQKEVRTVTLDNLENSLALALGRIEDTKKMIVPDGWASASAKQGKTSMFTDEQLRRSAWGQRYVAPVGKEMKISIDVVKDITLADKSQHKIKVGNKNLTIEAGYDDSTFGTFDVVVYDDKMNPVDVSPEGGLNKKARETVIAKVNNVLAEREDFEAKSVQISDDGKVIYVEVDDRDPAVIRKMSWEDMYDPQGSSIGDVDKLDLEYAKYLGSADSLDYKDTASAARALEARNKEINKQIKQLNKQIAELENTTHTQTKTKTKADMELDYAKKYLSDADYKRYKNLLKQRENNAEFVKNGGSIYTTADGATFVDSLDGADGYVSITNLKKLYGWEPDQKRMTAKEIQELPTTKADKATIKQMKKEMNKNLRSGDLLKDRTENFKLPENLDARSRGLSLNQILELEDQLSEIIGAVDSDNLYISKDMAELLSKISENSLTPGKFGKIIGTVSAASKWFQEQQMAGGVSWINALTIVQVRDAIKTNPKLAAEYVKVAADVKNSAAVRNFTLQNMDRLTQITMVTGDDTILSDLGAAISARPGVEDGGVVQSLVSRVLGERGEWNGPKSVVSQIGGAIGDVFNDPTFSVAIPVLRAKMLSLEYDEALRFLKTRVPDIPDSALTRYASQFAYAKTEMYLRPSNALTNKGFAGVMEASDTRLFRDFMAKTTGARKTTTFMDAATDVFFAMRYKMSLSGRVYTGLMGVANDIKSLGHMGELPFTPEVINTLGTDFMYHGAANGIYSMAALAAVAAVTAISLGIPTAFDMNDVTFIDPIDGEFKVPNILQKFQTIGQIWMPNAYDPETGFFVDTSKPLYGIDTMSSTFTLQNSIFKTVDRVFNGNAYTKNPHRGIPFLSVNNPINQALNTPLAKGIGDELFAANLLSPYKAMYEILTDNTYFGNNIWERKYLPDGSENKNYNPMRNVTASFMHLLGLDDWLDEKGYNRFVKGLNDLGASMGGAGITQDRIGTVSGSGLLQHEYWSAAISFLKGDYLEGAIEAGELPLKTKKLSSQARTEFNNTVKNTIAQYMSEYQYRIEGVSNDEKDNIYADVVQKCADVVANWSSKWDYVLGDDQTLVPYVTRTLMAMTAGEYDDNLQYLQNAIWKAENLTNIEHGQWSWLSDEDLDQWIAEGHTVEEFNAEKQRRTKAYNDALDAEWEARNALRAAGYDEALLEDYKMDDIRAEQRNVNKKVFTGILSKLESPVGEFKNFKEMKSYYEAQIEAASTTKQKAAIAKAYNTYVTDTIAPYADEYGAAILNDAYYDGRGLANTLAEYIILPADQYYRGKSPRASYLRDLLGVGYKDKSNLPSDEEVIELFANARTQIQKGATASAASILDRLIDQIKRGRYYASALDYSKIVKLKALLGARS